MSSMPTTHSGIRTQACRFVVWGLTTTPRRREWHWVLNNCCGRSNELTMIECGRLVFEVTVFHFLVYDMAEVRKSTHVCKPVEPNWRQVAHVSVSMVLPPRLDGVGGGARTVSWCVVLRRLPCLRVCAVRVWSRCNWDQGRLWHL